MRILSCLRAPERLNRSVIIYFTLILRYHVTNMMTNWRGI